MLRLINLQFCSYASPKAKQPKCPLNKVFFQLSTNIHCLRLRPFLYIEVIWTTLLGYTRTHPSRIAPPNGEYPIFLPPAPPPLRRGNNGGGSGEQRGRWHARPRSSVGRKVVDDGVGLPAIPSPSFPSSFRCRARAPSYRMLLLLLPPPPPTQLSLFFQLSHPVQMQSTERKQTRKRVKNQQSEITSETPRILQNLANVRVADKDRVPPVRELTVSDTAPTASRASDDES